MNIKSNEEAKKSLPPHLLAHVERNEKKLKEFGLIDLASLDRSKYDDFHPIHAMV